MQGLLLTESLQLSFGRAMPSMAQVVSDNPPEMTCGCWRILQVSLRQDKGQRKDLIS